MEGLKPELTSFLREAAIRRATSLNATDDDHMFASSTGLAGFASIAGGFDQVLLAAGGGGGAFPSFQVKQSRNNAAKCITVILGLNAS